MGNVFVLALSVVFVGMNAGSIPVDPILCFSASIPVLLSNTLLSAGVFLLLLSWVCQNEGVFPKPKVFL